MFLVTFGLPRHATNQTSIWSSWQYALNYFLLKDPGQLQPTSCDLSLAKMLLGMTSLVTVEHVKYSITQFPLEH